MKNARIFFKALCVVLSIFCGALFSVLGYLNGKIAPSYKILSGETLELDTNIPVSVTYSGESLAEASLNKKVGANFDVNLKMFGIVPIAKTNVEIVNKMYVAVLGSPFGMKIYTDGVMVVALSDVDTASGNKSPATECGLKVGDLIYSIDSEKVYTNEDVSAIIERSNGKNLILEIKRDTQKLTIELKPQKSVSTGVYKAGIWVRDSSAGIGTLTFYYPLTNVVCGLGHGICDADTGQLLSLNSGEMVGAEIISFNKAVSGTPGELNGRITTVKYGNINLNTNCGVYGTATQKIDTVNLTQVALKHEIENGEAQILTTINGNTPKMYSCTVKKNTGSKSDEHNMIIKITDGELLSATGGILQGMSGSPIIQNGKLIGAVTHVLVDDPTKGYGIFAENMLETAQSVAGQELKEAS